MDINATVKQFVRPEEIIFINSNGGKQSHDIDIYCVKKDGNSETHTFFNKDGKWVEVFIDSLENAKLKIQNKDALGMNYIYMLPFHSGNKKIHEELCGEVSKEKANYRPKEQDVKLQSYRIRISFEKINPENHEWANRNMSQALVYPFVSLLLGKYNAFPSSPKHWINQLQAVMPEKDFAELECLFDGNFDYEKIGALIEKHVPKLNDIDIEYEGKSVNSRVEGGAESQNKRKRIILQGENKQQHSLRRIIMPNEIENKDVPRRIILPNEK